MKASHILVLIALLGFASCKEECVTTDLKCSDIPTSGVCQAFFQNWFYDSESNSCEEIGYSGCEEKGFETKEGCELCKCNTQ